MRRPCAAAACVHSPCACLSHCRRRGGKPQGCAVTPGVGGSSREPRSLGVDPGGVTTDAALGGSSE